MSYSGKYSPKNVRKYDGDPSEIYYRSSWELSVMLWCDTNPKVQKWSSENVVVRYLCPTDRRIHRYFLDFKIKMNDERVYLVEIKPKRQTKPPKKTKRASKTYLNEVKTYVKNGAKWKAANAYALDRGWTFQIWTEDTLKAMGIKILDKVDK